MPDASARPHLMQRIADASQDGPVVLVCFERTAARMAEELGDQARLDQILFVDATDGRHATTPGDLRVLHASPVQLERIGMLASKAATQWARGPLTLVVDNLNRVMSYNDVAAVTEMGHYVVNHLKGRHSTHEWVWCGDPSPPAGLHSLADEHVHLPATVRAHGGVPKPADLRLK